ncbi:MAG: hypothetical protein M1838_005012 [Thelocarpon superellum]|nr:MAG: hypothetical protein M1838_005012 [Thelocarpon superellum]
MAAAPTVVDLKKGFLSSQIRLLHAPLQPPRRWQENLPTPADGDLRGSVVGEVLYKLNVIAQHHNKAVYSSQALRHVAEQIDRLYWESSDPSQDVGGYEVFEKGVDLTKDSNITNLPDQWYDDEGQSDDKLERYAELQIRLSELSAQRDATRRRLQQFKHLQHSLEPFTDPQKTVQPNLVTRDGELGMELDRTRILMARVAEKVERLRDGGDMSMARAEKAVKLPADPLPDAFFSLDGEGSTAALDMSLFPSFLTDHTGSGPTANRQAPSPIHPPYSPVQQQQHHPGGPQLNAQAQNQQLAQQQQQQQQNGYGLGPPGVPGGGVNVFPTAAGHQLDLNHLWGQVQELSGVLERNRESTQGLVRRVGEVRSRAKAASEADGDGQSFNGLLRGLLINGDGENGVHPPDPHTRIQELESSNALLESENTDLATLVSTYENALARILDQLRIYAHEHTLATLAIHKSYTQQLAVERATNLELRQDYCEFQGRISSLARVVREGLRYEEDDGTGQAEGLKAVEAWAEIQNENRVLRGLVGLPVDEDGR